MLTITLTAITVAAFMKAIQSAQNLDHMTTEMNESLAESSELWKTARYASDSED